MAITRKLDISIYVNGLNFTSGLIRYVVGINLEDIFDTSFTPSKLTMEVSSKYGGRWSYRDQIKIYLAWSTKPSDILETNTFYIDYIDDSKNNDGQTYVINALEADPNLGFTYGAGGEITITNKTVKGYITEFAALFGLTVTESMGANVMIGTIPIPDNYQINTALPGASIVSKKFKNRPEILQYICKTYGYFGNISGTKLQIFRLEAGVSFESDFTVPSFDSITNIQVESRYSNLYQRYTSYFAKNADDVLDLYDSLNSFNANTKTIDFLGEGAYWNSESGQERAIGAKYLDYVDAFRTRVSCTGFPGIKAGKKFYLGESYGQYSGFYRCLKANHRLSASGWTCDFDAFPLDKIYLNDSSFKGQQLGTIITVPNFYYTQDISGTINAAITGTLLDNFARSLNTSYATTDIGATFIAEGATEGIRADIAFCLMLVETNNWRETTRITRKNPSGVGNAAGTDMATFTTWQLGVRAEIQHLFAYAVPLSGVGTRTLVNSVVDPRYSAVSRGTAKTVSDLSGRWTSSSSYGQSVLEKMKALYTFLGNKNPTLS
jgi:hypothetical protein